MKTALDEMITTYLDLKLLERDQATRRGRGTNVIVAESSFFSQRPLGLGPLASAYAMPAAIALTEERFVVAGRRLDTCETVSLVGYSR